jgi:hypothetical protein
MRIWLVSSAILFASLCGPDCSWSEPIRDVAAARASSTPIGAFIPAGNMNEPRYWFTATLLPNGKVLIAGGGNNAGLSQTAELYDPVSRTFSYTGKMVAPRLLHTATLLPNGKVLLFGGTDNNTIEIVGEVYDPSSGKFTGITVANHSGLIEHTATLLPNGEVLIAGGFACNPSTGSDCTTLDTAFVFDPSTGTGSSGAFMSLVRRDHQAVLLQNGQVLVAGGDAAVPTTGEGNPSNTAEIYDPDTNEFSMVANMVVPRSFYTANLLGDGTVLLAGGTSAPFHDSASASAEIFNLLPLPSHSFSATGNMSHGRYAHTASPLPNGQVLLAGGSELSCLALPYSEVFDPTSGHFVPGPNMAFARYLHSAVPLSNGAVLVAGGLDCRNSISSAELFIPPGVTNPDPTVPATLSFGPNPLKFGKRKIGTTVTRKVTVRSPAGNRATVQLRSFAVSGADYYLNSSKTTCAPQRNLAPGRSCTIAIDFKPQLNIDDGFVTIGTNAKRISGGNAIFLEGNGR